MEKLKNACSAGGHRYGEMSIPFKLLLLLVFFAFIGLGVARLILPCIFSSPSEEMIKLLADLSRWTDRMLTSFLALLAGKAMG